MAKARLLLILIMLIFAALIPFSIQSNVDDITKAFATAFSSFFILSALTLIGITFFTLDEQGRVPHGSLAWKYFAGFYGKSSMPERIKLCPAYWMIFLGIIAMSLMTAVSCLLIYVIALLIIYGPPTQSEAIKGIIAIAVVLSVIGALAGITYLISRLKNRGFLKAWISLMILAVASLLVGLAFSVNVNKYGMSPMDAALTTGKDFGIFILTLGAMLIAAAIIAVSIIGLCLLLAKFIPWIKNSLLGRIVSAVYHDLCPIIPMAPAPAPAPKAAAQAQ